MRFAPSTRMDSLRAFALRIVASGMLFALLAPAASAASVQELLSVTDTASVTRGDFIRGAVKALDLPTSGTIRDLPYERVPAGLVPFVQAAYTRGALRAFGLPLDLQKPITRGEAAQVLADLADITPAKKLDRTFTDVKAGSPLADGVAVALEKSWMRPLRSRFFGADRPLKGRDAKLLLSRAMRPTTNPRKPGQNNSSSSPAIRINLVPKKTPKTDIIDAVWNLLNDEYLYQDRLDPTKAGTKAVQGLVESLNDPYTNYLPPSSSENFQTLIKGEVDGIGATVEQTGGLIRIVSPLRGSPAEKAGLQPHDVVLAVDGKNVDGMTLDEAVNLIRGPKGTTVRLKIRRSGSEIEVPVTRDTIKIPEIEVTDQGGGLWVVRLVQFGQTTDTKLRQELTKIQGRNPRGIVLDLRSNPGGLLHAAGVVISNFVPDGTAYVSIHGNNENYDDKTSGAPTIDASVKLAVLVNRGSASASEIVAGALQDLGRAKVVGEKTFGKGTVQQLVQFSDGSSLKFTVAEWYTPKGRKIDGVGIEPDVVVQASGTPGRDQQLEHALDLVR